MGHDKGYLMFNKETNVFYLLRSTNAKFNSLLTAFRALAWTYLKKIIFKFYEIE